MDQKNSPPQATTNVQSAVNVFVNNITVNINGGAPRVSSEGLPGNHSVAEINLPNFPIVSNTVNSSSPQGTGGVDRLKKNHPTIKPINLHSPGPPLKYCNTNPSREFHQEVRHPLEVLNFLPISLRPLRRGFLHAMFAVEMDYGSHMVRPSHLTKRG